MATNLEEVPTGHEEHVVLPAGLEAYVPALHTKHVLLLVAKDALENEPRGQGTQCVPLAYVPGAQARQDVDPGEPETVPGGHNVQLARLGLPLMLEDVPGGQEVQAVEEFLSAYEPLGQAMHASDPLVAV